MTPLPPDAERRLTGVLARLRSSHDGEALNAARLAVRLLDQYGRRPEELTLDAGAPLRAELARAGAELARARAETLALRRELETLRRAHAPPAPPPPPCDGEPPVRDAAGFARRLLEEARGLTGRDREFLSGLVRKGQDRVSEKQAAWLRDIARKVPAGARWYGA
jgi:hypothetical protein